MNSSRMTLWLGAGLVLLGALFLAGGLFNFNPWIYCWPIGLIGLGIWFVTRPAQSATIRLIGDIHRNGVWPVVDEEFTQFVGDIRMDLTQANLPLGETRLRFSSFVSDITLVVPPDAGISLTSNAFVTELNFLGQRSQSIFMPVDIVTPGYATAERRLRLEANAFVLELNIRPGDRV